MAEIPAEKSTCVPGSSARSSASATPDRPGCPSCRVLIIVPAYNESASIVAVLESLRALPFEYDVVVVNDGSTDSTAELARRSGAQVLDLACNLGVGGAVQTGYQYAQANGYDVAVQFDGDGQHCADQVELLVEAATSGRASLVIGSRRLGQQQDNYKFPLERDLGSRLLAGLVSLVTRRKITDPTSGFRAANRRMIRFFSRHYPQTWLGDTVEALVLAARHGFAVEEVPARMQPRRDGNGSANLLTGLLHTLRIILAVLVDCLERKFNDDSSGGEP